MSFIQPMFHLNPNPRPPTSVGARNAGKGCGFLCHGHDAGHLRVDSFVHALQKRDGFKVLAPTMNVRHPFAIFSGIVAIEHRGHGIDPQAVDMMFS